MKGHMHRERNMAKANSHGQITVHTLESFMITIFMEVVFMNGLMVEFIQENGEIIKWKGMAHSHGLMVESM